MTDQLTIEITTGHCLGGEGNDVVPGQLLVAPRDLSLADARKKVRMGYARVIPDAPAVISTPDPVIENRDPEPELRRPRAGRRIS